MDSDESESDAMQTRSESLSLWLGVSILAHAMVFLVWADWTLQAPSVPQPVGATTTRVALRFAKPAPVPAPPAVATPQPAPPEPAATRPSKSTPPPPETTARPRPTEAAIPMPVVPPEPAAPPAESVAEAAPAESEATAIPTELPVPAAESEAQPSSAVPDTGLPAVSAGEPTDSEAIDLLPSYVAEVRARIEQKKRYPAMARRRGDEGLVLARIAIAPDGDLVSIDIEGRASLFLQRATREAVERARPFPMPPRGAVKIEVPVRWQVRR